MAKASYAFFRYQITDVVDDPISWKDHATIIEQAEGELAPHRKVDPEPHDHDTFIMRQRKETIASAPCVIFDVAKKIMLRVEHRYNSVTNDLELTPVKADDTHWTHVIMVPNMGMVAIRDGSGERLTADSGASRIRSILRHSDLSEFEYERTATSQDVMQAIEKLGLTTFSFSAIPSNPHPGIPGQKMDDLLKAARIGKLTAKAEPKYGDTMTAIEEGLIAEAVGLAQEGYGQYGFKGITKTGTQVSMQKPKIENTKEANLKNQRKNTTLRVIVPEDDAEMSEEEYVVKTMLELYNVE